MTKSSVFLSKTESYLEIVQEKAQTDERAMPSYHFDPLGQVPEHASVADLALPCLASLLELQDVALLGSETTRLNCLQYSLHCSNFLDATFPAL